jgi:hypothetical protein
MHPPCKRGSSHAAQSSRQQQRRRALLLAAALAALAALCPPGGCAGVAPLPVDAATHTRQHRQHISEWLPHCARLVGQLTPHQARQLRTSHQQYVGARARVVDLDTAIRFKEDPERLEEQLKPTIPLKFTWATPQTLEQVRALDPRRLDPLFLCIVLRRCV